MALVGTVLLWGCAVDVARVRSVRGGGPVAVDLDRPVTVERSEGGDLSIGVPLLVDVPPLGSAPTSVPAIDTIRMLDSLQVVDDRSSARAQRALDSLEAVRSADSLRAVEGIARVRSDTTLARILVISLVDSIRSAWAVDSLEAESGRASIRSDRAADSLAVAAAVDSIRVVAAAAPLQTPRAGWTLDACTSWARQVPEGAELTTGRTSSWRSSQGTSVVFGGGRVEAHRYVFNPRFARSGERDETGELREDVELQLWLEPDPPAGRSCPSPSRGRGATQTLEIMLDFDVARPVEGTGIGIGAFVLGVVAVTGLLTLGVG